MTDQLQERHFAKLARLVEEHTGIRLPPAKRAMVEGRLRNFYAECCLAEQPFVKDDKKTVGQVAKEAGMKLVRFVRWELPKE